MVDIGRVALVTHGSGQALGQTDLAVDTPEQEGPESRTTTPHRQKRRGQSTQKQEETGVVLA